MIPSMLIALTRPVPPSIAACELTHLERAPIDIERATRQHAEYEEALRALGARVERVEAAPESPDSVFVEDTAVVLDEVAVLTRPGAVSRRAEVDGVGRALAAYRELRAIAAPATIDGGDVLQVGREVFVGLSLRTNREALEQLTAILEPFGYRVQGIPVERCLHLKSAVTAAADELLVLDPDLIDGRAFGGLEWIPVAAGEPGAANVVRVGSSLLCPEGAPETCRRLEAHGLDLRTVAASELAKAEGALTCCSLIFRESPS
jgi:dimethylargininase